MVKPEWGTKRVCPKCGTRFYDLGKEDPVACIECGTLWEPEPFLKSKQPLPFDAPKKETPERQDSDLSDDEDLDIDEDAEQNPDDDVDLGGDDDIGLSTDNDDDEN
ncbi:TIGR02300 family protein [Sphingomonas crocodyli]|uniref:TIGR02300 family protein n=1 Tax=Sphingomonas crocodyli TaxID=1979270 RepID=A0A437MC29_9SPHN|nr:TIGR02300 family protein [Sphingomonas crocodyli]RVT95211.1 TIGR02300 family protein [Sphingomonas crocodyli]